ncbi:MAG: sigma-70 family RNA polymerase sigma factor, partial [Actinomycetota bacterium]|nr:sigma-70 family RNA polymerase sigma factor [Actinomycetota bacterium]
MEASTLSPFEYGPLAPPPVSLAREPDERLISLVRGHEVEAFEALYARYRRELLGYCRRMLGSHEDAEDVLQEVFAAAYRAMMANERPIECRPWLYRITHNRCLNEIRRRPSTDPLPAERDDGGDSATSRAAQRNVTTADEYERKETFRLLVRDIQALPRAQRRALVLREVEGCSYDQIAGATQASLASVRSLLLRARQGLAEAVEAREIPCAEVMSELLEANARGVGPAALARRHVSQCERCALASAGLKRGSRRKVAALLPVGPLVALKQFAFSKLGTLVTAGCGPATGTAATVAGTGACSGTTAGLGAVVTGVSGLAVKAGVGLAVAA